MIERMKIVHIVTADSRKADLLDEIRNLGVLHLAEKVAAEPELLDRFSMLSRVSMELKDYEQKKNPEYVQKILEGDEFDQLNEKVISAFERKKTLTAECNAARVDADKIRGWGSFDPEDVKKLRLQGIDLHFYRMGKKELGSLFENADCRVIHLASVDKMETIASVGPIPDSIPAMEFELPEKGLGQLESEITSCEHEIAACDALLRDAARYQYSYQNEMLKTQNRMEYSSVSRTADGEDGLTWLTGYIPEPDAELFTETAKKNGWAYAIGDPQEDDEHIPTKVKYNKLTALMEPVFEILGTVPGYREYDISFWFLCFFTLFFAMIIGDAGYGCIFLIGAVLLTIKDKKVNNLILLLYVLSVGTIVWGALTGTWFGLEGAMQIPFFRSLVIPQFANYPEYFGVAASDQQNMIMKFCFIIGTIQLALACVMNIRKKIGQKNLSWIADIGWLLAICALYFVVLYLVIGQHVNLLLVACIVGAGFLLVVLFGGMSPDKTFAQGLKAGVADAFTVFLNTISAFGNIMSYIRLFAVGMASLAIAQSFNNMAAGFQGPAMIAGILIMIIGHVLNIVMGFLSVVVHGVRLNLLEFSGQLNMEWSGTAYEPFKKLEKLKK